MVTVILGTRERNGLILILFASTGVRSNPVLVRTYYQDLSQFNMIESVFEGLTSYLQ